MIGKSIEELAIYGLGEFVRPTVDEEFIGTDKNEVTAVCEDLRSEVITIQAFISGLETAKTELIAGGWTGEAASLFTNEFPKMIEAFSAIESAIKSTADWTESTSQAYNNVDTKTAEIFASIFGKVGI